MFLVALTEMRLNFDEFKSGRLQEKRAAAIRTLRTIWNNVLKDKKKTKETCVEMARRRTRKNADFYPAVRQAKEHGRFSNVSLTHVLLLY
jgi:hypothetical protein